LKPANVIITPTGLVKVLDFGIAKMTDPTEGGDETVTAGSTGDGVVIGTPAYMSPEQARGQAVDKRTDIWAFGCVLYEMLTGQRAFDGGISSDIFAAVLTREPDWAHLPPQVPPAIATLMKRCLERDSHARVGDVAAIRFVLEEVANFGVRPALAGELAAPAQPRPRWHVLSFGAGALVVAALAAVAYFTFQRRSAPNSPAAPPAVSRLSIATTAAAPLASVGGLDLAISPDGRRIVYFVQLPGERVQLYVRELDGLDAKPLAGTEAPGSGGVGNMNPFFSADGKSIGLFVPGRGVISVPIDGGPPVKILDPPVPGFVGASWAADNTLIYSSGFQLQRVSGAGGGTPTPLIPQTEGRFVASPVPLPGGRAVLFHIFGGGTNRIAVINLDTKQEKTLLDGASNTFYLDTGHLAFARGDTLMAVPFNLAELSVVGDPVALVQGIRHPAGGAADFVISGNGTLAYVPASEATEATYAVVWVDRRGNVIERAVPDPVVNGRDPRLSPDGKHLLLVTGLLADGDLWNYDLAGRPPIPLARGNSVSPVWDATGREVAFTLGRNSQILTLPADGTVRAPRVSNVIGMPQTWSADGALLFQWPVGNPDILATSLNATGETRKIVASEYGEFNPALAPSGRWLAYVSTRTGQNEIWVQGYPSGTPVRVSSNGGDEPLWSANGSELFFRRGQAMMAVKVGSRGNDFSFEPPQELFSAPFTSARGEAVGRSYDVSRDGRFLMMMPTDSKSARTTASIIVVQNFVEDLKRRVRRSEP
jgi:Tol biopolymer transport system component